MISNAIAQLACGTNDVSSGSTSSASGFRNYSIKPGVILGAKACQVFPVRVNPLVSFDT